MKTRMISILTGMMLLIAHSPLNSQKIYGKVVNGEGEPLPGATVQLKNSMIGAVSNKSGAYQLNLTSGSFILVANFLGYQKTVKEVQLDKETEVNFVLTVQNFITDEVVITTTRADQDAPISQVTRSKEDIETNYTGQDGAFLLEELSPSIVSFSESGTGLSNYGGLRLRGIDQSRVNMTLNGVPLNDMIDQGVFFSNFTDLGNSMESVQIQRGVGTSVNGTSSYAGSINFESISLSDENPFAEVQLTGGSFNTRRASAEVGTGKMDNNFAFYTRYTHTLSDGFRYNASTNSRSFFTSAAYFGKKNTFKFTGFYGRSENGLAYGPVALSDIQQDPRTNYVSPNDKDNFGQWMAQFQHIAALGAKTTLVNTAYYGGAGGDFPFGFTDVSGAFTQINYPLYNDHLGVMSILKTKMLEDKLELNTGIHGYRFWRKNIEQIVPNYESPYYNDNSFKSELSAFAKLNYSLEKLQFYVDVQFRAVWLDLIPDTQFLGFDTSIPTLEWTFINPKGGISYDLSEHIQGYTSFGRTGREPTRFDLLGSTQINGGNIDLLTGENLVQPEYVNDIELGARFDWTALKVNINGFYMQFENEIAPIGEFIPQGFVQVYENQEPSFRTGVELDYAWQFLGFMSLRGHLTYMKSEIESYTPSGSTVTYENVTPILSPELNVQTTLEARLFKKLKLGLTGRYLSEAYMELTNDPSLVVPESFVADLDLNYNFYKEHSIAIQFNNILDNRYYTYGAPVFTANGEEPGYYVQPPRHIYVTLKLKF